MKPENIKLSEEFNDFEGPVSFCLNRLGHRTVGCSTMAIWNLFLLVGQFTEGADAMDALLTIRAGIKEDLDTQAASHENVVNYFRTFEDLEGKIRYVEKTDALTGDQIIKDLAKNGVALLFSYGVESMPNQGHMGVLHITNKKLYLCGSELDIKVFSRMVFSSKLNHLLMFERQSAK
jgi:hypothetical protein